MSSNDSDRPGKDFSTSKHITLGGKGEDLAKYFLEKKGYRVLEQNWRFRHKEVDIIAFKNKQLIVVEVKTRSGESFGYPEVSVNKAKQKHLAAAAEEYLYKKKLDLDVRFDVISITLTQPKPQIFHIEDAFFPHHWRP